jgi:hypothetical protein
MSPTKDSASEREAILWAVCSCLTLLTMVKGTSRCVDDFFRFCLNKLLDFDLVLSVLRMWAQEGSSFRFHEALNIPLFFVSARLRTWFLEFFVLNSRVSTHWSLTLWSSTIWSTVSIANPDPTLLFLHTPSKPQREINIYILISTIRTQFLHLEWSKYNCTMLRNSPPECASVDQLPLASWFWCKIKLASGILRSLQICLNLSDPFLFP